MPKILKKKSSTPIYLQLELDRSPTKKNQPKAAIGQIDEQWVKDLQIFKRQTPEERALFEDILKHDEITTDVLIAKLNKVETLSEEVSELKQQLQDYYNQYKWALETEKRQIAARDELVNLESATMESDLAYEHYHEVKKEILQRIKLQIQVRAKAIIQKREASWVKYQAGGGLATRKNRSRL